MKTTSLVLLSTVLLQLSQLDCAVEKVRINPATRLYEGREDGRVRVFHGLASEDSSPPWTLNTYNDEQIELMKSVSSR